MRICSHLLFLHQVDFHPLQLPVKPLVHVMDYAAQQARSVKKKCTHACSFVVTEFLLIEYDYNL